jgi:hypothetical protein
MFNTSALIDAFIENVTVILVDVTSIVGLEAKSLGPDCLDTLPTPGLNFHPAGAVSIIV